MASLRSRWKVAQRELKRKARSVYAHVRPSHAMLFYNEGYRAPDNPFSDTRRAEKILNYLRKEGAIAHHHIKSPWPTTIAQLAEVHPLDYLQSVGEKDVLLRIFGETSLTSSPEDIVAQQRSMVAGTLAAARLSLKRRCVAINLGGGMHHARTSEGAGFCLFNDVAVAIAHLRENGFVGRILVVDLDLHHGDGTRSIFAEDASVFTYSIHAADWDSGPAVADLSLPLGSGIGDQRYLEALDRSLPPVIQEFKPEMVFYMAGVDIAEDDKLGSWRVTHDGILQRDKRVLEWLGHLPFVWTLAGGYGPEAWRHSARSIAWHMADFDRPIPSQLELNMKYFRRISRRLKARDLTVEEDDAFKITEEDVYGTIQGDRGSARLFGFYSRYGLEIALERYGVLPHLRKYGVEEVELVMDLNHATGQLLRLYSRDEPKSLFVEAVLRESSIVSPFRLIFIEWMLLQNPRKEPSPHRPLLPGQNHPGLGVLRQVIGMLLMCCERLKFDGLVFRPAHYHVGVLARTWLRFVDPRVEGRFLALQEIMEGMTLSEASSIVHAGGVRDKDTGETVSWDSELMVLPVSEGFRMHLESTEYLDAVAEVAKASNFERV